MRIGHWDFLIWRLLYSDNSGVSLIHEARIPREIAAIINSVRYQHHSLFSYRSQVAQAFSNNLATDMTTQVTELCL